MKVASRYIGNRTAIAIACISVVLLVVYFAVVPVMLARSYTNRISTSLARARSELKSVSTGKNVLVFQDPDITPSRRQALITQTLSGIKKAQGSLDNVQTANTLLVLPGVGFVGAYHRAAVRYERANNAIGQSRQVLKSYTKTLTYINALTEPQLHLDTELTNVNAVRDFSTLNGNGGAMLASAEQLQADYDRLKSLTPPPEFETLHNSTLQLLDQASTAFEHLGKALNQRSDPGTDAAISTLEQLTNQNDKYKLSFTEIAQKSPTLQQLVELPEKIEHVEGI